MAIDDSGVMSTSSATGGEPPPKIRLMIPNKFVMKDIGVHFRFWFSKACRVFGYRPRWGLKISFRSLTIRRFERVAFCASSIEESIMLVTWAASA